MPMRRGYRKYDDYLWEPFLRYLKQAAQPLGWADSHLALEAGLNPGTYHHARQLSFGLKPSDRAALIDVVYSALDAAGESPPIDREFLEAVANLPPRDDRQVSRREFLARLGAVASAGVGALTTKQYEPGRTRDDRRHSSMSPSETAVHLIRLLEEHGEWAAAAGWWQREAEEARTDGNLERWASCSNLASGNLLTIGSYDEADDLYAEVWRARTLISQSAASSALIGRGWVAHERGDHVSAGAWVKHALDRVAQSQGLKAEDLRDGVRSQPEYWCNEVTEAPIAGNALHFLGRCYVARSMAGDPNGRTLLRYGRRDLALAARLHRRLGHEGPAILGRLRLVVPTMQLDLSRGHQTALRILDEVDEAIAMNGVIRGHVAYVRGCYWRERGDARRSITNFRQAIEGYTMPAFYKAGRARASRELAQWDLASGTANRTWKGLESAILAAVHHPYGEDMSTLADAVAAGLELVDEDVKRFRPRWENAFLAVIDECERWGEAVDFRDGLDRVTRMVTQSLDLDEPLSLP